MSRQPCAGAEAVVELATLASREITAALSTIFTARYKTGKQGAVSLREPLFIDRARPAERASLGLLALTTIQCHFITPTIVGRRITSNPLLMFLALAF